MQAIVEVFRNTLMITTFVFIMMVWVDYLNVLTRGRLSASLQRGRGRQYLISSFLGATPGCLGAFMNVSFFCRLSLL